MANTSDGSSWRTTLKAAAHSAGVPTRRPTDTGFPAPSFLTVYRIVSSRSLIVPVVIGVSSVCPCCGSFTAKQEPNGDTGGHERSDGASRPDLSGGDVIRLAWHAGVSRSAAARSARPNTATIRRDAPSTRGMRLEHGGRSDEDGMRRAAAELLGSRTINGVFAPLVDGMPPMRPRPPASTAIGTIGTINGWRAEVEKR